MPIPPKEAIQPILDNLREPIVATVLGAWGDWIASPYVGAWRCKRSRANFVWEQIIDRAHVAFAEEPSVQVIDGQETFKFLIEDSVLFRFKKGDDAGVTANIPTQIALAFHDHEQNLFGLPEVYRVEVIYQLNMLETEVVDVLVVARDGNAIAWSYSLLDSGEGVVPLPMPAPSEEPPAKPAVRLVRLRDGSDTRHRKKRD